MNDRIGKRRPIDLEELDRQLRDPGAQKEKIDDDPLAELARLVNSAPDPFTPMFAKDLQFNTDEFNSNPPPLPPLGREAPSLRPTFDDGDAPWQPPEPTGEPPVGQDPYDFGPDLIGLDGTAAPPKKRRVGLFLGGGLAAIFLAIVGTLAFKGRVGSQSGPPTVLADSAPYRVPGAGQGASGGPAAAGGNADAVQSAHIVNNEEQPVDLAFAGSDQKSAAASSAAARSYFPTPKPVKTVSVRPDGTIISEDGANQGTSTGDGSGAGAPTASAPTASAPAASAPPAAPSAPILAQKDAAVAAPSTPASDRAAQPTPAAAPKTPAAASVSTPPSAPRAAASSPSASSSTSSSHGGTPTIASLIDQTTGPRATVPTTPSKVATRVEPPDASAASRPVIPRPPAVPKPIAAKPQAPLPQGAPVSGTWAVQLAAPASEAEARGVIAKLQQKYGAELGGKKLAVRTVDLNGRQIWRVRAVDMSKAEAVDMCTRIKGSGGACFLAAE